MKDLRFSLAGLSSRLTSKIVVHLLVERGRYTCVPDYDTTPRDWSRSYNLTRYHALVRDRVRMEAFRAAIARHVRGKVVLEIGTGALSPLARMAAEAGASKVYAIEANPGAAYFSRRRLLRDKLADRIELIEGFSTDVALSEPAEVLIQELVGYMGCDEGMAAIVHDAKRRLLREDAVHIPASCTVHVAPVHAEDPGRGSFLARHFQRVFFGAPVETPLYQIWNFPRENLLTESQVYEHREFATDFPLEDRRHLTFTAERETPFTGFLFWVDLGLDAEARIDTFNGTTWGAGYLQVAREPLQLESGDRVVLETYQDLRASPRYRFTATHVRDGHATDLGTHKARW
jgi:hypothetical protein